MKKVAFLSFKLLRLRKLVQPAGKVSIADEQNNECMENLISSDHGSSSYFSNFNEVLLIWCNPPLFFEPPAHEKREVMSFFKNDFFG